MTARYCASPSSSSPGARARGSRRSPRGPRAAARAAPTASGTTKGMRASRIRRLARTSRWAIAAGGTAKAGAIRAASIPSTVWSISGVRAAGSMAGWAQTNNRSSRRSGTASGSMSRASSCSRPRPLREVVQGRAGRWAGTATTSRCRFRATVRSQPSGLRGTPSPGQVTRACSKAADRASSASARSPDRAASSADEPPVRGCGPALLRRPASRVRQPVLGRERPGIAPRSAAAGCMLSQARRRRRGPPAAPPPRPRPRTAPSRPLERGVEVGTSITKVPPSCSFVSAKGPSCTCRRPSKRRTVVVLTEGWSTSAASRTPAASSALA